MIGYRVTEPRLRQDIAAHKPGWFERAEALTEEAREQGSFGDLKSIWSEIKPVFMRLQGDYKCAYCERKLESEEHGAVEQDVEHYRPKNRVSDWAPSAALQAEGVAPTPAPAKTAGGYYLLAHHILNYCAACKPCNSTLKSDRFPIAGDYELESEDPHHLLKHEKPLLLFPLGTWDTDPEKAIGFIGVSPFARPKKGALRLRALSTIEFFGLDDAASRKNLFRERAMVLQVLFPQLEVLRQAVASVTAIERAQRVVDAATAETAPHASCARSFVALHAADPVSAEQLYAAAVDYVASIS